jgi:hypothetical protein
MADPLLSVALFAVGAAIGFVIGYPIWRSKSATPQPHVEGRYLLQLHCWPGQRRVLTGWLSQLADMRYSRGVRISATFRRSWFTDVLCVAIIGGTFEDRNELARDIQKGCR